MTRPVVSEDIVEIVIAGHLSEKIANAIDNEYGSSLLKYASAEVGQNVTEDEKKEILFEVCDLVHSSCDARCPVYELNGCEAPNNEHNGYGCDCFKSGSSMLEFIKVKLINGDQEEEPEEPEMVAVSFTVNEVHSAEYTIKVTQEELEELQGMSEEDQQSYLKEKSHQANFVDNSMSFERMLQETIRDIEIDI